MKSKVVENGKFEVFEDGSVYRVTAKGKIPANITIAYQKNSAYSIVTTMQNGKQVRHYVHRMIAEAFIPHEVNKTRVIHIDKDTLNNRVSNLKWVTTSELAKISAINVKYFKCSSCGKNIRNKGLCKECKKKVIRDKRHKKKIKEINKQLEYVNIDVVKKEYWDIIEMRRGGMTLQEIGDKKGISKERVRQIIEKSIVDANTGL